MAKGIKTMEIAFVIKAMKSNLHIMVCKHMKVLEKFCVQDQFIFIYKVRFFSPFKEHLKKRRGEKILLI